jgi:protein SCO1/2
MKSAVLILALCLLGRSAFAGLTHTDLASVVAAPPVGARLDLSLSAMGADGRRHALADILQGRPAFLAFADYTCNALCGTALGLMSRAIAGAHLAPSQYRIVIMGLDPKDSPQAARAMVGAQINPPQRTVTSILLPDAVTVAQATHALGYSYTYDAAADQFAHPAAFYVLGGDGSVRAVLSPFNISTDAIRDAIAPAHGAPRFIARLRVLCYAYDPATGVYTLRVLTLLKWAAAITVLAVATGVAALFRARRRDG